MLHILLFLILSISPATQSDSLFIASDSLFDKDGIIHLAHQNGWRFHPGDDLNWANTEFDDRQGTGLGLSLAYGIVKAQGGELSFNSDPATGTQFTVTIKTTEL